MQEGHQYDGITHLHHTSSYTFAIDPALTENNFLGSPGGLGAHAELQVDAVDAGGSPSTRPVVVDGTGIGGGEEPEREDVQRDERGKFNKWCPSYKIAPTTVNQRSFLVSGLIIWIQCFANKHLTYTVYSQ